MDNKLLIGAGLLAVAGVFIYKKMKKNEENTNNANEATADLNDPDAYAALLFKQALSYEQDLGIWHGKDVDTIPSQATLYNACLHVTNWAGVQKKFSLLCNNEATLLQALQDNTDSQVYNFALELIKKPKVITTAQVSPLLVRYLENGQALDEGTAKTLPADTIIGCLTGNTGSVVSFINGFESDGGFFNPELVAVKGSVNAGSVQIINP